jgi:type IV pilus assembly protein PilY1
VVVVFAAAFLGALAGQALSATTYNECKVPPQISVSFMPNVLLVMDYSGSMQNPAYTDPGSWNGYSNARVSDYGSSYHLTGDTYNSSRTYFGYFKSDRYYKYYRSGGYFYEYGDAPEGGVPGDKGTFSTGIRGNILNWLLTSRMDAALKALVGGKASAIDASTGAEKDCEETDGNCYLAAQGARRAIIETTAVDVQAYIRPSTWSTSDTFSNNWNSSSSSERYPFLHLMIDAKGVYRGHLTTQDDKWNNDRYHERWRFNVYSTRTVELKLTGEWTSSCSGGRDRVVIVDSAGNQVVDSQGRPAEISRSLGAGTYYVRVMPACAGTGGGYRGSYSLESNVSLYADTEDTGKNAGTVVNKTIGAIRNARVRVQIVPAERRGAIHDTWNKANWGFMYYKGEGPSHYGKLLVRCGGYISATEKVDSANKFAKYLEGKLKEDGTAATDGQPYPYSGTPTCKGLDEAINYFKQSGGTINTHMFDDKSDKDPYYTRVGGELKPVACRKSFVILMSDGVWSSQHGAGSVCNNNDPIVPAKNMHTSDLRTDNTDLPGNQTADVYTIFAFAPTSSEDYIHGSNSMKWIAMYGGFTDLTASTTCQAGWPYPKNSFKLDSSNNDSTDATFNITQCTQTTPNACCKEWTTGTGALKGIPDNYFDAQSGDQLVAAIQEILSRVSQKTASSSAVATVAQQTGEGDQIIRAMFEAKPPDTDTINAGKLLWWGHLEAYWPNKDGYYEFELSGRNLSGSLIMCKDFLAKWGATGTDPANCWDAAIPATFSYGPFPNPTADTTTFDSISSSRHSSSSYTLPGGRRIFYVSSSTDKSIPRTSVKRFTTANVTAADLGLDTTTKPTATNKDKLINWVLGTDDTTTPLRERKDPDGKYWVLGDMVYSTPVVVGPPALGAVAMNTRVIIGGGEVNAVYKTEDAVSASFNKWYLDWRQIPQLKYRDKFVYVGGNDGMIHAFLMAKWYPENSASGTYITKHGTSINTSSSDKTQWTHPDVGKEVWAFIPSNLLTELKHLADPEYGKEKGGNLTSLGYPCEHRFMVDLAPRAFEVIFHDQITSTLNTAKDNNLANWPWRTVLLGGERGGGDMYFALDVTDPYNPKVLWEYSVLKDLVATFDYEAALPAFMQACYNCPTGTNNNSCLNPGDISTCQAPEIPTSWWNNHCDNCASCLATACTETDKEACRTKLRQMALETATWKPFNDENLYKKAKKLPMSWSRPYVGRVGLPLGLKLNPCDPHKESAGGGGLGSACFPKCTGQSGDPDSLAGVRNLAFIGGGIRVFDSNIELFPTGWAKFYTEGFKHALVDPFLLALDLETGINAFRYVWPTIFKASKDYLPSRSVLSGTVRGCDVNGENCSIRVPYAMSDPVVLDVWDRNNNQMGEDGYSDRVYVGDMNGILYGIKMNFNPFAAATSDSGFYVDLWKTKPIPLNPSTTNDYASNIFRSRLQPLTIQPAVSIERDTVLDDQRLRIIIAGGKHEDVEGNDATDATDTTKMALYNVRDKIDMPTAATFTGTNRVTGTISYTDPDLRFVVRANCEPSVPTDPRYRCTGEGTSPATCDYDGVRVDTSTGGKTDVTLSGCQWLVPDKTNSANDVADCCEDDCVSTTARPCWNCVYDLTDKGEKVINKPLIAGGIVFFTTFSPLTKSQDVCKAGGIGYLYAFDYMCQRFPEGFNPIADLAAGQMMTLFKANNSGTEIFGAKVELGLGVPSQPVLDSTGNYLIIQRSTAEISRVAVNLLTPVANLKGWKEK